MFNEYDLEFEEFLMEEELINESSETENAESQIKRLMQHMLKHQYQPERQGKSWCNTIGDAYVKYDEIINNNPKSKKNIINNIDLDKCYKTARNDALGETKLTQSKIPKDRPDTWDIDYITNYDNIISFLRDKYNPYATYNFKSEEDMVEFMKSKLK